MPDFKLRPGMTALLAGFGGRLHGEHAARPAVALPIRSTLRGTLAVGLAIGAGIATVDALYAAAGAAGAAPVLTIDSVRTVFGLVGAAVLFALARHALERVPRAPRRRARCRGRHSAARVHDVARRHRLEPVHDRLWGRRIRCCLHCRDRLFDRVGGASWPASGWAAWPGSTLLAFGVAAARPRVGQRLLKTLDAAAGSAIIAFGGLLAWRTLREGS